MKKVIIIGAGVSGVYLSILLKQKLNEKMSVIVLEQNSSSLKKLLATGNGRCNLWIFVIIKVIVKILLRKSLLLLICKKQWLI